MFTKLAKIVIIPEITLPKTWKALPNTVPKNGARYLEANSKNSWNKSNKGFNFSLLFCKDLLTLSNALEIPARAGWKKFTIAGIKVVRL
jgi:hypothetical protein